MPATFLDTMLCIALVFIALSLLCAVWFARPDANRRIGRRGATPADPFASPFGDLPGFNERQLRLIARGAERNIARDPLRRSFPVIAPEQLRVFREASRTAPTNNEPVGNCPPTAGGRRRSISSLGAGAVRFLLAGRADA